MIDDLADAAQWACEQGFTTPGRMGIMGRSYGGCAALCASWRYKKLFSCAIAEAPPTNLVHTLENTPSYWRPLMSNIFMRMGHPRKDRTRLQRYSPALNTERIEVPVLCSYGAHDVRVHSDDVQIFINRLRETNNQVTVVTFPDEGHRSRCQESIMHYHEAVERFLTEHLPLSSDKPTPLENEHASHPDSAHSHPPTAE